MSDDTKKQTASGIVKKIPYFLRWDTKRAVFAFLFAALIYYAVDRKTETKEETISNVKIDFVLDQKLVFASEKDKGKEFFADVIVNSKNKYLLSRLSSDNFKIKRSISVSECNRDGKTIIKINKDNVEMPDGVQITEITPCEFELNLDEIVTKKDVPIVVKYENELPEGYSIRDAKFQSGRDKVDVTGPSKLVNGIKEIHTKPIPRQGATDDFTFAVGLEPQIGIQYSFDTTTAEIMIDKPNPKEFTDIPVKTLAPDVFLDKNYSIRMNPRKIDVFLEGGRKDLNKLSREDVHPYIDISKIDKPGVYDVSVKCWCDNDSVKINLIKPDKVTVYVNERDAAAAQTASDAAQASEK